MLRMELVTILRVVRRRWWVIMLLPVVSTLALGLSLRSRPPTYEASVNVQITTPQREDVAVYEEYRYGSLRDEITVARNNFTEVLRGNDVREQTATRLGLNHQEEQFPIDVTTVRDADFIRVTVEAGSPVLAAKIANTLVSTAIDYYGDLRARATYAERDLFAGKVCDAEASFRAAQERFTRFQVEKGVVSLDTQLETYQRLLEQLQLERDRLLLEETTRAVDPVSEVDQLIAQHQQELNRLAALVPAYNILQEDVQLARENYQQSGEGQSAEEASSALEELRAAEDALADFKTEQGIISLESELATYQRLLEQLQLERDQLLLEETTRDVDAVSQVDDLIARRQAELDRLSALLPTYDLLSGDLSQVREQYSYILNKYTEAELTAAAVKAANFIQIVEPAQPPTGPASDATMLLLLTIASSVGGGVLLAFLLEYISAAVDDSISLDEGDGQSVLGMPIIGLVPRMVDGHCEPDSLEAEAVRQLRTRLLMSSPDGELKTLLVTSPQPEDGKSIVAANLGVAMAASGVRVVLVDADVRVPGLHEWFEQPNLAGLTDCLKAEEGSLEQLVSELVLETHIPGLSLMAAGPPPQDPSSLLASDKMGAVVAILSERFERVVVDGPPVVVAPDALSLARVLQSTLVVLSPDHTSRRIARQAIASLSSRDDIRIIGAAINRTSLNSYGYHYNGHPKGPLEEAVQKLLSLPLLWRRENSGRLSTSKMASIWAVCKSTIQHWRGEDPEPKPPVAGPMVSEDGAGQTARPDTSA